MDRKSALARRSFIRFTACAAAAPWSLAACSSNRHGVGYEALVRQTWRHADGEAVDSRSQMRELVRYATLAPSSHNTQCWKFGLRDETITILPDYARRCPIVDPDDHHLFVSLGCAAENLIQAALAGGLNGVVAFARDGAATVTFERTKPVASALFEAIPRRQCTRTDFDGAALSSADLRSLERAAAMDGVRLLLITERKAMENVLEYVVQGNSAQLGDSAFIDELKTWIRFDEDEAVRARDGLFSRASGNPAIARWLGNALFRLLVTATAENDKCATQVRSSAGIAIFVSDADDKRRWFHAGRSYERFALQAAALGIRNAFLNQPVEVPALRRSFAGFLGIGDRRPDLVVRFGRGPEMPKSLRRPVEAVLV